MTVAEALGQPHRQQGTHQRNRVLERYGFLCVWVCVRVSVSVRVGVDIAFPL